jgi:3-hydroxyisobutyrate dehydrogenase
MGKQLGFIGLGNMGSRMATRLIEAGNNLIIYNRTPAKAQALVKQGAVLAQSIRGLAEQSQIVLLSLSDDAAVSEVIDEALMVKCQGKVFIDLSTVLPETSMRMAQNTRSAGAGWLDAAVSGSTPQAASGELVIMLGGDQAVFDQCRPILARLGHKIYYMGPSGSGAKTKLAANTLLGLGVQAIAESLLIGQRMGLEKSRLIEVLSESAVVSPSQKSKLTNAKANDYSAAFPLRLMYKDFGLIMSEARQIAAVGMARGLTDEDFSVVVRVMEELVQP